MKFLTFALINLFILNAQATTTQFDCVTTANLYNNQKHSVSFQVENLNSQRPELLAEDDDYNSLITFSPERSPFEALGENWSIVNTLEKFEIHSDSDGFFLLDLVLYKNSGLKHGYVKVRDIHEGFGDAYSKVTCEVTQL